LSDIGLLLRRNVAALGLPGAAVRAASAAAVLAAPADRTYDVVLVDPPYAVPDAEVAGWLATASAHGWLADDAVVVVERGRGAAFGPRRFTRCGTPLRRHGPAPRCRGTGRGEERGA
jgi:16S rRNA (guanine966-N2)-methyltransferase